MQHGDLEKIKSSIQKSATVKNLTGIVCSLNNISSNPYILLTKCSLEQKPGNMEAQNKLTHFIQILS